MKESISEIESLNYNLLSQIRKTNPDIHKVVTGFILSDLSEMTEEERGRLIAQFQRTKELLDSFCEFNSQKIDTILKKISNTEKTN